MSNLHFQHASFFSTNKQSHTNQKQKFHAKLKTETAI